MKNQRGFTQVLILLLLLVGLVAVVYLMGQKTNFFSRAANSPIVFKSLDGKALPQKNGVPQTTSSRIKIEFTSTLGPSASSEVKGVTSSTLTLTTPSKSCTPKPACLDTKPACKIAAPKEGWCPVPTFTFCDVNQDKKEDTKDGALVISCLNKKAISNCVKADTNKDGQINSFDKQKYATSCPKIFPTSPTTKPTSSPKVYTVSFKFAENPVDLDTATYQPYTKEPMVVDYEFKDKTPGKKFIWVEYKDSNGKTDRRSSEVDLVSTSATGVRTQTTTQQDQHFAAAGKPLGDLSNLYYYEWNTFSGIPPDQSQSAPNHQFAWMVGKLDDRSDGVSCSSCTKDNINRIFNAEEPKIRTLLAKDINKGGVWIVGNEANFRVYITAADYAEQYKKYYGLIKGLDPTAKLSNSGLIYDNTGTFIGDKDPVIYLDKFLNKLSSDKSNWPDIYNIHFYPNAVGQGYYNNNVTQARTFKTHMTVKDPGKPIWVTEFGMDDLHRNATTADVIAYMDTMVGVFKNENLADRWFWFLGDYESYWEKTSLTTSGGQTSAVVGQHYKCLMTGTCASTPTPTSAPTPTPSGLCNTIQQNSVIRGCSNYVERAPIHQPTANDCLNYCNQNNANACEWNSNGSCYVEFGSGCQIQGGFSGWSATVCQISAPVVSSAPQIIINTGCTSTTDTNNLATISWVNSAPSVTFVDISADNFASWYNHPVSSTSVNASAGFTGMPGTTVAGQSLTFRPNTTYYVRLWNGQLGGTVTFITPNTCPVSTPPQR